MRTPLLALVTSMGALTLASACGRGQVEGGPADSSSSAAATSVPAVARAASSRLTGKWLRPDGGYVLDLRAAAEDGKLEAGYFNPNPIHVAEARWEQSAELGLVVFVELRDTGYPGATYRLRYRAADDKLIGAYTQPAAGQTFEVEFVRQP